MARFSVAEFVTHCADWSAPFEVAERMCGNSYTPNDLQRIERGLKSMRALKMADYNAPNNTYKCFPLPHPGEPK